MADGWKKSKLSEAAISSLVSRRLLQSRALIQWQSAEGHGRPFEKTSEIVLFKAFVECGLAISACDFLWGLLFFWGVQLDHLTPNSILHIAIFVQLCEAFLGIHPHFDLFKSLFSLNPYPNLRNIARVGVLISSFTLAWRRSISHIICAIRLGIGKQSGFISITMLLLFRRGLLGLRSRATSGVYLLVMLIMWESISSGLLSGEGRGDWGYSCLILA